MECGQHWARSSANVALDTAVRFLRATGAVPPDHRPDLASLDETAQRIVEVTERVTVETERFAFAADYRGFEVVPTAGTVIAHDGERPVRTPYDDCVLIMPSQRLWPGQTAVRLGRVREG